NPQLREQIVSALEVEERQAYDVDGLMDLTDLWQIVRLPGFGELRDATWAPVTQPRLQDDEGEKTDVFAVMRDGDVLVHHPYDPGTARLYTDIGLFTVDEEIGADVADMFNFLTGYARPGRYRKVLIAPKFLRDGIIAEIEETIAAHERGERARIALKMNALVD